jgi:hypothetical protein
VTEKAFAHILTLFDAAHIYSDTGAEQAVQRPVDHADWLNRRASNAMLIAQSRARIAAAEHLIGSSDMLARQSAKLVRPSSWEPVGPRFLPLDQQMADAAIAAQARYERSQVQELHEAGISLRGHLQEVVLASKQLRWRTQEIRTQSAELRAQSSAQKARSQRLRSHVQSARCHAQWPLTVDLS